MALEATTGASDVDGAVERARRDGLAGVVVPPAFVRRAAASGVTVGSVVAHPNGWEKPTMKAIAATGLAKDGATHLAVTPLAANLIAGDLDAYRHELLEIARGARAARPTLALSARIDLGWPALDLPAIGAATIRGAFDGVVLESTDVETLVAAITMLRAIDGLNVAAMARESAWADRLLVAGATRVAIMASA